MILHRDALALGGRIERFGVVGEAERMPIKRLGLVFELGDGGIRQARLELLDGVAR